MKKQLYILFLLTLFLLANANKTLSYPGKVLSSFSTPGTFPTGLTFDGKNLWLADRMEDKLFCINKETGEIIRTIKSPAYWPMGLAWDGEFLWNADVKGGIPLAENYDGTIYKIDPKDGTILHTIKSPTPAPRGLTWDGKYLWCVDNQKNMVIQFDPKDGTTIKSFISPAGEPRGITFDGKYLWISDRSTDEIYMVDPQSGIVLIVTDAPGKFMRGLSTDGKYLWAVDHQTNKIFKLVKKDDEKIRKTEPHKAVVTHTHQTTNFGPGKVISVDVHLAIPVNRDNQTIDKDFEFNPEPTDFVVDKWGQKTAHFKLENIPAGKSIMLQMKSTVTIFKTRYFIFPDMVGSLEDIPKKITKKYLENNSKYQYDNEIIQNAVKESVGGEKNPFWIARKMYNYLMERMYYEMTGGWNTAPTVLARGNGSCSEYAFVYISMCRAAGLPARYVGSVVIRGDYTAMDDVYHRWVEIYLPNYGWIPVDPSGGDSKSPRHQALRFGNLSNGYLITTESGGGSKTMEWTYNSNEFWVTEPKTNVIFENFADWDILRN